MDDGRFRVAVKGTGPVDGMWHHEYAVQNVDNDRGGASNFAVVSFAGASANLPVGGGCDLLIDNAQALRFVRPERAANSRCRD